MPRDFRNAVAWVPAPFRRLAKRLVPARFHPFNRVTSEPDGFLIVHRRWRPRRGIVHVGAHLCEERAFYRSLGIPDERVLWIEAQPDIAARAGAVQAVVSDVDGDEVSFTVTRNSVCSSMLRPTGMLELAPGSTPERTLRLRTITLDSLYQRLGLPFDFADLMVLDIQGAELNALHGAGRVLSHVRTIITEVEVRELYEGQALYRDVRAHLEGLGFREIELRLHHHAGWGGALFGRLP